MTSFSAKSGLHQAPLKRRKLSHLLLVIPLAFDASQVNTKSCGMISGISKSPGWATHQPAAVALRRPATIKMLFTTLVAIVRSGAASRYSTTRQLPVSICFLCVPSDNKAIREPMKTYNRNLGKLQIVATMNCQTDTDCID